jgi:hypothetical protein
MPKIKIEPNRHSRVRPWQTVTSAGLMLCCLVLSVVFTTTSGAAASTSSAPTVSSPAAQPAGQAVVAAAARTLGLRAAFTMTFAHATPTVGSSTPRGAEGSDDFAQPSGTITLELPGGSSDHEQMVFLPGTIFVKPPSSSRPLRPGRPWIFANFADIAKFNVAFPPYIVQTECVNPALVVSELNWGTTSATAHGTTVFHGTRATRYRATVNLTRALANASGPATPVFAQTITSEITASGGTAFSAPVLVHIDAWVDAAGRLVGARVTPPGAGIGTVTLALDHFGTSVVAAKPPRAKVVDIAAMIPGGEQEALNGGDSDGA